MAVPVARVSAPKLLDGIFRPGRSEGCKRASSPGTLTSRLPGDVLAVSVDEEEAYLPLGEKPMVTVPVMLRPGSSVSVSSGPVTYVAEVLKACVTPTML